MSITAQHILNDRATRKAAGLTGCITGKPTPPISLFGFGDIQIWYVDANGRMNGDPEFDEMNPLCFCFDCRDEFDSDGAIDAQLVNNGHVNALYAYRNILANPLPSQNATSIPTSLPLPIPRDVMNEDPEERLRNDLIQLKANIQSDLIVVMDKRRLLACMDPADAVAFSAQIDTEEAALYSKINAIDLLLG